ISIFKGTEADIKEKGEMIFAMLTRRTVRVFTIFLRGGTRRAKLIDERVINMEGYACSFTLIAMGSLRGIHDVWLFNDEQVMVWKGMEGKFEKETELKSTGIGKQVAVASITVKGKQTNSGAAIADVLCVMTSEGRFGLYYTLRHTSQGLPEHRAQTLSVDADVGGE
ncbi:hypothetical protein PFISCL1PPCAC_20805, partial [Pristionchus fissidentatus]